MTTLLPVAPGREVRAYARRALRGLRGLLVATALVMSLGSVAGLAGPVAIGAITQAVVDRAGSDALVGPVALLVVAALAAAAGTWAGAYLLARLVLPPVARLREDVLTTALALPPDALASGASGDLVARVTGDVERVDEAAQGAIGAFVGAALTIVFTLVGLAALDWRFAVAGLLAVPVQAHTLRWYLRVSGPLYAAGRSAEGRRTTALLGAFSALTTVRAFRFGPRQHELVDESSRDALGYELQAVRAATRFYGRLNLAELIGLGAILLVAFLLVDAGAATVGAATTAALFFAALFGPINTVLGVFDDLQQATAALARLVGVTLVAASPRTGAPAGHGDLVAHDLTFGYGDDPAVVRALSVHLHAGEHVAVVGTSGSGKSTLATLVAGLRVPRTGRISLAGAAYGDLDEISLRQAVALVTQETHVFAGSVADNLRLGRPDATGHDLRVALDAVGASGWVELLPEGLDTPIGAGGRSLTASQEQHLALARLVLVDPAVVILDEATAEGGSDTALLLDDAARRATAGRSALVVAHRLSQAVEADRVLVMSAGVIVEEGTHDELRARGGAYARLWRAWATQVPIGHETAGRAGSAPG